MTTDTSRLSPAFARILALLFLSVFINYIDRSNLSIAAPLIKDELGISASQLGILLSAFFWTYSSCQLLSGWLVDHYDVKWVFAGGFLLWSSATAITGTVHTLIALLLVRIVLGIGESVAYPGYSKILALHCQEGRRGFANALIASGLALGPSFGLLFGGTVVARIGWRPFFIGLGLVSLLWLIPWARWMPATETATLAGNTIGGPGMREILVQRSAWGTCVGLFCANYFLYFMVTWLPFYLVRERHLSMSAMAKIGGGFFFTAALSASACGWLSDRWILSGISPTIVRKTFMVCGAVSAGVFLLACVLAPLAWSIAFLMLTGVAFGLTSSNMWAITQRLAGPQAVGRWCGLQFVGNSSGVVAPAVAGFLLDRTGHFFWPFLIVSLFLWAGGLMWILVVGPIEPVEWTAGDLPVGSPVPAFAE